MPKEYIDRDKILPAIEAHIELPTEYENIEREIRNIPPAADVAPVVHGEWINCNGGDATCSHCKTRQKYVYDYDNEQRFCGHCGAKMDGGKE